MDDKQREELERRAREAAEQAPPLTPEQFAALKRILSAAQDSTARE